MHSMHKTSALLWPPLRCCCFHSALLFRASKNAKRPTISLSPCAVHNIAARISPQKMNPEFKLVELSQKHFSLSPLIVSHSFLVPASGGREGFMKCLYCPKLVPKVMLKSERRCQCKMQQHGQSAQQRPKMLNWVFEGLTHTNLS